MKDDSIPETGSARMAVQAGLLELPGNMPAGTPGDFSFTMQMWTPDAGGPAGADATNTLQATTPP